MELQAFVTETFKAIINGVKDAQEFAKEAGAEVNPNVVGLQVSLDRNFARKPSGDGGRLIQIIEFDVAIAAAEHHNKKDAPDIVIGKLEVAASGENSKENSSTSRIKFSIPVALPYQK